MNEDMCLSAVILFCFRFSFGIGDVWPSEPLNDQKKDLMRISYETCSNYIERFEAGDMTLLDSSSSSSLEEALEFKLTKVLNEVRSKASAILTEGLHWNNTALNMYSCKSKGSKENIAQMTACVGQQAMGSSRIPDGFLGRSLPHFHVGSKYPDAKGFVKNSFFSGVRRRSIFVCTKCNLRFVLQDSPPPSFSFTP
jgi:DNA-directed RNA polymerase III subunit RPC1